ncbi:MFS transporter [Vibrio sp. 10N.261.55.A7]|uniref:MFS transporter n=1 Tax=Vibrio sp. 10N.261.55.A7 TaxID=1880851 RepID=UPI000C81BF94|nr:MFS transporter [Vibrio sp. 10N.261.55.A7]PMJ92766.1 MFS transporter [Vibrio sp. 10N.261.55.A7]
MKNKTPPYLTGRFFDGISSGLFMMALPWIILQTPNMGTFVALTALACTAISFVLTPIFSTHIDRRSRKSLLILNQVIQSATAMTVVILYWLGWQSHWILAGAQLLFWVSSNFAWQTNNAFTQENYDKEEYASISGYQEVIMQTTTLGAGALGIVLLEHWGMVEFGLFASTASGIAALAYLATPYRQRIKTQLKQSFSAQVFESASIFKQAPQFYLFLLLSSLSYPILTFLGKLVPIWFAENNIEGSWYAAYNISFGAGSLLTGLLVSRILSRFQHQHAMQTSMFILVLMLLGMAIFPHPIYLIAFTFGFGFFNATNRIARVNLMHHTVSVHQRGRVDGGITMFSTLAQSLSYVVIALLSHYQYTEYGFYIAALVVLIASVMMLASSNSSNRTTSNNTSKNRSSKAASSTHNAPA